MGQKRETLKEKLGQKLLSGKEDIANAKKKGHSHPKAPKKKGGSLEE